MESRDKSDDKNPERRSNDGKESSKYQASSKFGSLNPEKKSHNTDDLKTLDFNSADEIRQAMKAVLSGNPPQPTPSNAEDCGTLKSNDINKADKKSQGSPMTPPFQMIHKTVQIEAKENLFQCVRNDKNTYRDCRRKRPGRPPKAGTSKKLKKPSVSAMYVGKLSNVVPFKRRRYGSDSESDELDSLVILY